MILFPARRMFNWRAFFTPSIVLVVLILGSVFASGAKSHQLRMRHENAPPYVHYTQLLVGDQIMKRTLADAENTRGFVLAVEQGKKILRRAHCYSDNLGN
jgi:hypothetical protein